MQQIPRKCASEVDYEEKMLQLQPILIQNYHKPRLFKTPVEQTLPKRYLLKPRSLHTSFTSHLQNAFRN